MIQQAVSFQKMKIKIRVLFTINPVWKTSALRETHQSREGRRQRQWQQGSSLRKETSAGSSSSLWRSLCFVPFSSLLSEGCSMFRGGPFHCSAWTVSASLCGLCRSLWGVEDEVPPDLLTPPFNYSAFARISQIYAALHWWLFWKSQNYLRYPLQT